MKQIVFWQNFPNHLQSSMIRTLADNPATQVTLVCQEDLPEWRRTVGWLPPDFGRATVIIAPSEGEFQELLDQADSDTFHIFSGIRGYPFVWRALQQTLHTEARVGIYSEAVNWQGYKGVLRLIRGRWEQMQYGSRINFILAIGHLGVQWFQKCGYFDDIIYPFGYFVERSSNMSIADKSKSIVDHFRLIFIGQCIRRKGLDIFIKALREIPTSNWHLDIVGDGESRQELEESVSEFGLDNIRFYGALPNDDAMALLNNSDLLVLPSRWDGWGAVVNEALLRGVPVICSTNCGAADLLKSDVRGAVFSADSVEQLRDNLYKQMSMGKLTPLRRETIKAWAEANISGETAASYLLEILQHSQDSEEKRAIAPWFKRAS